MELAARADGELVEDLAQVVVDGVGADEQPGTDLGIRQTIAGHRGDLGFPRRQITICLDIPFAGGLAGGS